ncbi:AAA family ATPase [Micromonospora zamorensis]|uniref:AAA family ATPase n=1 Tax=Micromonospora zamorensis TaxID=709883 RepID=UPI00341118F0
MTDIDNGLRWQQDWSDIPDFADLPADDYRLPDSVAPPPQDQPPLDPGDLIFRTLAEVAADVDSRPPRTHLFEPVWPAGDYGVASAEDKAGKTWGVLDAAVSAAAGLPWMGVYPCRTPGPVIIFLGEGGDAKILRRLRAVASAKGLTRRQADALPIILCFRAPHLGDQGHLRQITAMVAQESPVLVILDPLYLAAQGANGADLYAMGAMLGNVQRITQGAGAALMIAHHWNKTGTGAGHHRSSGVGPGAWGRVLISVHVKSRATDPVTKATTVTLKWEFRGDEIPDTEAVFVRQVWADDPDDLNSSLHYVITPGTSEDAAAADPAAALPPAAHRVLLVLRAAPDPLAVSGIGDVLAKEGRPLKARTIQAAISKLAHASMIVKAGERAGTPIYAAAAPKEAEDAA